MEPNIHISMTAVIIALIANFIFGAIWYMPLFGKTWAREMKMDPNGPKPPASVMIRGMVIMLIGSFLMVFVFAHNIAVWNPVTWNQPAYPVWGTRAACEAAFFTFLGFFLPQDLSRIAWEGSSWKLFFINAGYHFLSLLLAALILVRMM